MRQLTALVWKEWHETQLFLWIGWGLFIGLPIIGGIEGMSGNVSVRFEFYASLWVLMLGPVLAIVVGVAVTCRDVQPKLEDFWESRPIGGTRLFVVKYVVAAAVLLLTCCVPMGIELLLGRNAAFDDGIFWMAFVWLAVFSIAFAVGCVVRRTAHAAAMAIVGTLLLFFIPVVFPPLGRFMISQIEVSNATGPAVKFAGGMLVVAAVTGAIGLLAVRRHWHIESSKPLIYGAVSISFLILITSASYQLGTNLPVLDHLTLPEGEITQSLSEGSPGYMLTVEVPSPPAKQDAPQVYQPFERSLNLVENRLVLGNRRPPRDRIRINRAAVSSQTTSLSATYYGRDWDLFDDGLWHVTLKVWRRGATKGDAPLKTILLWKSPHDSFTLPNLYMLHDRLYVVGQQTMVFDVSDPASPRLLSTMLEHWQSVEYPVTEQSISVPLPPAPGLSASERFNFWKSIEGGEIYDDAKTGLLWGHALPSSYGTLVLYRLVSFNDSFAKFDLVAKYQPALVQRFTGMASVSDTQVVDGLLYQIDSDGHLTVYDLRRPKPLTLIAHFDVRDQRIRAILVTPDGRIIVDGGDGLWLLGAARQR